MGVHLCDDSARILIVDDDRHVRALVRRLLERASYVCATI